MTAPSPIPEDVQDRVAPILAAEIARIRAQRAAADATSDDPAKAVS